MELPGPFHPRISKQRLSGRGWSLRITIVIFLSAFGGLISSIFLFERAERPNVLTRWKREAYTVPKIKDVSPATTSSELGLDAFPFFRIGPNLSSLQDRESLQELDAFAALLLQEQVPFDATVRLPLGAAAPAFPAHVLVALASEAVAPENVARENATQTQSTVRAIRDKMRKRQIAEIRRRVAKRVVRKAKSIASFWAIWSRHFFSSGLNTTSSGGLVAHKAFRRRTKGSPWFPLSWQAARGIKYETGAGSSIRAAGPFQSGTHSNSNRPQFR